MFVSKGMKYKCIMMFQLYLSHFSAPQAPSKPLKSKLKAITMKETSISMVLSHYGCSNMSKNAESSAPQ